MSVSVLNTTSDLSGKTLLTAEGDKTVTGNLHFDNDPNEPFTVAGGSAKVANLDADKLDGYDESAFAKLADNETVSGSWTFNAGIALPFTNASIELGALGSSNVPLIDFHSGAASIDYDSRIIASSGTGVVGEGSLALHATPVELSKGQLLFPATQNPSTNANTLDDYEEGTWTPGITFGGAATGLTYTAQSGNYIKVGQRVWISGRITVNDNGSSTGDARITNLPFTSHGTYFGGGTLVFYSGMSGLTGQPHFYIDTNNTVCTLQQFGAASTAALSEANIINGSDMIFVGHYRANA